ncbi:MAG: hypothetical protein LBQ66_11170 [Planctomycetaceae bacterium]|nr:hypothetical protein [Planctomycetaceae bacterium]
MPVEIPIYFSHHWGRGQASPLQRRAFWFYRCAFRPAVFGLLRSPKTLFTKKAQRSVTHLMLLSSGRLPTLRCRHFFGVQFKLFWFYYTQRRAGRPRSSPSPLRGKRRLSPTLVVWYIDACSAPLFSACFARRKRYSPKKPSGRLPTLRCCPAVGCPPYVTDIFLAFRSNFFGSITHRGGRDARVPVRRRFAANLCGITRALSYAMIFCPFRALINDTM